MTRGLNTPPMLARAVNLAQLQKVLIEPKFSLLPCLLVYTGLFLGRAFPFARLYP